MRSTSCRMGKSPAISKEVRLPSRPLELPDLKKHDAEGGDQAH